MLDKTFDPQAIEAKYRDAWEASGAQSCDPASSAEPYTIMMPPPNVTGSLHMGHGLTFSLQDLLIRYHRMRGHDTLWQPGMDHAGIAVQNIIERKLDAEGTSRVDIGRDEFLRRAWEWKEESGGRIFDQLRHIGSSADWPRERFTMDEGLSDAVLKVFVRLHKQGLIYKDNRLVNWDPKLKTAISDLEVESKETNGNLWHFRYPIDGEEGRFITVATTRPETMLGDTGVAVHPDDERYKDLIGKFVKLPLVGRLIPIVADEYADPETGSGAVKITPAHDFNDFEVGKRCNLETINILDNVAALNDNVPEPYRGLDRFDARKKVAADLDALGLLEKIDDHPHKVPYGDRSGVVIEPWLTEQWYVDAHTLAQPALKAVEDGRTKFVPQQWENTYYAWLRNIQPWCISRQLWWGHQIPAWYAPDGTVFVAETEAEAQAQADAQFGAGTALTRDPDVLDTWFSSALWPFSTIGWPEQTAELKRYYPGNVLVTAHDIIFFWVARMMMFGMHFMDGEVPFREVYIHALVRDEHGAKMSKSKGNIVDPLEIIEEYGTDALRFTLAALAVAGRDIKLARSRVAGYRNFATKLWNASRFAELHEAKAPADFDPSAVTSTLNQWIVGECKATIEACEKAIKGYHFNEVADSIYHFTWHVYCDYFVELSKSVLFGEDEAAKAETRAVLAWALGQICRILHPIMPFVTEELWANFVREASGAQEPLLISAAWPDAAALPENEGAKDEINRVIELITAVRSTRSELSVAPSARIPLHVSGASAEAMSLLTRNADYIQRQARVTDLTDISEIPEGAVQLVVGGTTYILPLAGVVDFAAEEARLEKEIAKTDAELDKLSKSLGNAKFLERAPTHVVAEQKARQAELTTQRTEQVAAKERFAALNG